MAPFQKDHSAVLKMCAKNKQADKQTNKPKRQKKKVTISKEDTDMIVII